MQYGSPEWQHMITYYTWLVIISGTLPLLTAYDETDPIIIEHNGGKEWNRKQIGELITKANRVASGLTGTNLQAYRAPTANTAYCIERLAKLEPAFLNVIAAGIAKIEGNENG